MLAGVVYRTNTKQRMAYILPDEGEPLLQYDPGEGKAMLVIEGEFAWSGDITDAKTVVDAMEAEAALSLGPKP